MWLSDIKSLQEATTWASAAPKLEKRELCYSSKLMPMNHLLAPGRGVWTWLQAIDW